MGSDLRFNYSVLGDPVNLASRLEGQSKNYGLPIILGSRTASALGDRFAVLEIDRITVKGKTEPESVYTALGAGDVASSDRFGQLRHDINDLLTRFRQRDFAGAAQSIERCRKFGNGFGLDHLLDLYSERIRMFEENPPPPTGTGSSCWRRNSARADCVPRASCGSCVFAIIYAQPSKTVGSKWQRLPKNPNDACDPSSGSTIPITRA